MGGRGGGDYEGKSPFTAGSVLFITGTVVRAITPRRSLLSKLVGSEGDCPVGFMLLPLPDIDRNDNPTKTRAR